jgi:heat shock protein HslJ
MDRMISTLITSFALIAASAAGLPATEPPLTGTHWVVTHLVHGPEPTPLDAVRPAYLVLHPSGDVEGYDTCNWITATATAAGDGTVTFTDFGTTKRGCHDSPFRVQMAVTHVVQGEIAYRIEADALHLTHPDGRGLILRAQP